MPNTQRLRLLLAALCVSVIAAGCRTAQSALASPSSLPPNTPLATATQALATPSAGRRVSDQRFGYSVILPSHWEPCTTTEYSRVYCTPQSGSETFSFPAFYISVIPDGFTNDDGSIYNFVPEEVIRRLLALSVGEALTTDEPNPEHSTFTRLPDAGIAGAIWLVIENARVWEGRPDKKDRRLLLMRDGRTYMIGAYYRTGAELLAFERATATLALTP